MSEEDGVLPDKADDVWSGGLDDAGQATARPATAGPGANAGTCPQRDQARSEHARAQLPEPGRRYQDATGGRGSDRGNNTGHAATATTAAAGVAVARV